MDRLPEKVLLSVLQYMTLREAFRFLRVNRAFNVLIRNNWEGFKALLQFRPRETDSNQILPCLDFKPTRMRHTKFWMESDNISFDTQFRHYEAKMADYLAWKTGTRVIKKDGSVVVPVPDPLEAFFMLLDLIVGKSSFIKILIDTSLDTDFRQLINDRIQPVGLKVKVFAFCGKVPIKEVLFLNREFQITHFTFRGSKIHMTEKERMEGLNDQYKWTIDYLLRFQSFFTFSAYSVDDLESWSSVEAVFEDWKRGILSDIAASFSTSKFREIRKKLNERPDVLDYGTDPDYGHNFAIIREVDLKCLWIQIPLFRYESNDRRVFAFSSMSGDICADILGESSEEKKILHTLVDRMNEF